MNYWLSGFFLEHKKVGGVENYLYSLLEGSKCIDWNLQSYFRSRKSISAEFLDQNSLNCQFKDFKTKNRFIDDSILAFLEPKEKKILFYPNYFTPTFRGKNVEKIITVIHDLQFLRFPQNFLPLKRLWLQFSIKNTLLMADQIIVPSSFVADEIEFFYGDRFRRKVTIIHSGVRQSFIEKINNTNIYENDKYTYPFLVSIGNHYPNKNFVTFLKAFKMISTKHKDLKWIILGETHDNLKGYMKESPFKKMVSDLNLDQKVFIKGYVTEKELLHYLANASAFINPSLYEGFGFAPLEAAMARTPIISSNILTTKEVLEGLYLRIQNPLNENEWADAIDVFLSSPKSFIISKSQADGLKNKFSSKIMAENYYNAFLLK